MARSTVPGPRTLAREIHSRRVKVGDVAEGRTVIWKAWTEGGGWQWQGRRWWQRTRALGVSRALRAFVLLCPSGLVFMSSFFHSAPLAPDGSPDVSVGAIPTELLSQVTASNNIRFISVAFEPDKAGMQVAHVEASDSTPGLVGCS